jgi:ABC-type amino acid transport substrate-binding protein
LKNSLFLLMIKSIEKITIMMNKCIRCLMIAGIMVGWWMVGCTWADQSGKILKVGISPFAPFVMIDNGKPKGYAVDVWEKVAEELDLSYEFDISQGVSEKLKRLIGGKIDIAIGGITVTEKREEKVDFCHPHFQAGLDILIPVEEHLNFGIIVASFFTRSKMVVFGIFLLMIIIFGHLIWLVERRNPRDQRLFRKRYWRGLLEGMYWAIVTASTVGYGDKVARTSLGRLLTCFIIVGSLPLFAFFIAELSSDITLNSIRGTIEGPEDLYGKRVGVVAGTTSEDFMDGILADVQVFDSIDKAYQALEKGTLAAVVYDQPNLLYYANRVGQGRVAVVGKRFAHQEYGWALQQAPESAPRRETLNRVLLALQESGELERIHYKWFGKRI